MEACRSEGVMKLVKPAILLVGFPLPGVDVEFSGLEVGVAPSSRLRKATRRRTFRLGGG